VHELRHHRLALVGCTLLAAVFVASRVALLLTSFDQNQNWEEPVFLFSALDLQRVGATHIFDYQDDLSHGGSLPLILLAIPWLAVGGTGLLWLKGIAIAWSTATLVGLLFVAWRYFSPRAAVYAGALFTLASPTLARLNVTLVGSHPEATLPCLAALAFYLEWAVRSGKADTRSEVRWAVALGVASGIASWMSLMAVPWVAPLVIGRIVGARRRLLTCVTLTLALFAALTPWFMQNMALRPHGALQWTSRIQDENGTLLARIAAMAAHLAGSLGTGQIAGLGLLTLLVGAATLVLYFVPARAQISDGPWVMGALYVPPALTFLALALVAPSRDANESYYYARFFATLQTQLFLLGAVALAALTSVARAVPDLFLGVAVTIGASILVSLLGAGNSYTADLTGDLDRGCHVYGAAEYARSGSPERGMERLRQLPDRRCRDQAWSGFGWGVGGRYAQSGNLAEMLEAVEDARALASAQALCGGIFFVLDRSQPPHRRPIPEPLRQVCAHSP